MIHFVDDTHLSYAVKRLRTIESVMNCELKKLAKWLRSNKLSLNSGKPELVIFCRKTKKEPDEITIKINKSKLSPVPNLNYLGIVLDEFLCWDAHVNNLCKKLVQTNGILSKLCHSVPQKTCFSVYFSLLYLFTLYGSLSWQFTSETNLNRVFILQKKCLCIITFSFHKDHINKNLKLLKLHDVLKSEVIKCFYKFSRNELLKLVCSQFNLVHEVHTRNTGNDLLIYIARMSTSQ